MIQVDEQLESVWPSAVALVCILLAGCYVLFKPFGKQTTAMESATEVCRTEDSDSDEAAPTANEPTANEPRDGRVPVKPKGKQHKVKKAATATATAAATAAAAATATAAATAADAATASATAAAAAAAEMELSGSKGGSGVGEALLTACTQEEINVWVREWSDAAETTIPKSLKKACKQLKISKGKLEEWLKIATAQQEASKAAERTATGSATTTAKPSAAAEPSATATSYDPREFQKPLQVRWGGANSIYLQHNN